MFCLTSFQSFAIFDGSIATVIFTILALKLFLQTKLKSYRGKLYSATLLGSLFQSQQLRATSLTIITAYVIYIVFKFISTFPAFLVWDSYVLENVVPQSIGTILCTFSTVIASNFLRSCHKLASVRR